MRLVRSSVLAVLAMASLTLAQTPTPTTRPTPQGVEADKMLDQLLRAQPGTARPIQPMAPETDTIDRAAVKQSVAPGAPQVSLKREGDMISRRVGHVQRSADGQDWELHFESDGKTMQDPPMILLPNLKLTMIENALHDANRDLRFTVTGTITEYKGRNYLLVEKFTVEPEEVRP